MQAHHGLFEKLTKAQIEQLALGTARAEAVSAAPQRVFGRLAGAQSDQPGRDKLEALAKALQEASDDKAGESDVDSGFVFFGQFIDHDLTLDATTKLGQVPTDETSVVNFRTPRLELDSVYLNGPEVSPYLYDGAFGIIFGESKPGGNPRDLQRNSKGVALIGDPRNDENLFISQLHGLFIQLHNSYLASISNGSPTKEAFEAAREYVRGLYQQLIVEAYLPAIVAPSVLKPLVDGFRAGKLPGPVDWANAPDMPVEFSAAAFRFGHSQIRDSYRINASTSGQLFDFGGFQTVPKERNIDWNLFFDLGDGKVQKARKIDTKVSKALLNLPDRVAGKNEAGQPMPKSLPERNMVRGQLTFRLPYGEKLAKDWSLEPIPTHPLVKEAKLDGTPLWLYVLAEAEHHGAKLGPVGGTIVAGVILNLLLRDPLSIAGKQIPAAKALAQSDASPIPPSFGSVVEFIRKAA